MTSQISGMLEENKQIYLNIYEIRIDSSFIENQSIIETFLYECQCALFLIDITNIDSFKLIKDLLNIIKIEKFPYLKRILVQNKLDLESKRQVTSCEIKEYLDNNPTIDNKEISLYNLDNVKELIKIINKYVNETKNELPTNIISENIVENNNVNNNQKTLDFILLGDSRTEKTSFISRFSKNHFNETFLSTIGIDKEIKYVKIGNDIYKITLWDTAGQDRFKPLPKKYYANADGVLLLFNVTNIETFNNVQPIIKDIKQNSNDSNIYLLGDKIDDLQNRVISKEEAEELAKSLDIKYFEISCKINMNIPEVMIRMILECYMKTKNVNNINNCFKLNDKNTSNKQKRSGCSGVKENIKNN